MERILVDTRTAAELLSQSERTVWQLAKDGNIPSVRIGKSLRFSVDSLKAWVSEQENS